MIQSKIDDPVKKIERPIFKNTEKTKRQNKKKVCAIQVAEPATTTHYSGLNIIETLCWARYYVS